MEKLTIRKSVGAVFVKTETGKYINFDNEYMEPLTLDSAAMNLLVCVNAVISFWGYIDKIDLDGVPLGSGREPLIRVCPGYCYRISSGIMWRIKPGCVFMENQLVDATSHLWLQPGNL